MDDLKVRRWAGGFGVAGFIVFLVALPLYFIGMGPAARLEDTAQFSDLVTRTNTFILIRATLADPLIMVGLVVFLAGFCHLVKQARPGLRVGRYTRFRSRLDRGHISTGR